MNTLVIIFAKCYSKFSPGFNFKVFVITSTFLLLVTFGIINEFNQSKMLQWVNCETYILFGVLMYVLLLLSESASALEVFW